MHTSMNTETVIPSEVVQSPITPNKQTNKQKSGFEKTCMAQILAAISGK